MFKNNSNATLQNFSIECKFNNKNLSILNGSLNKIKTIINDEIIKSLGVAALENYKAEIQGNAIVFFAKDRNLGNLKNLIVNNQIVSNIDLTNIDSGIRYLFNLLKFIADSIKIDAVESVTTKSSYVSTDNFDLENSQRTFLLAGADVKTANTLFITDVAGKNCNNILQIVQKGTNELTNFSSTFAGCETSKLTELAEFIIVNIRAGKGLNIFSNI